jgi:hypothetical protein
LTDALSLRSKTLETVQKSSKIRSHRRKMICMNPFLDAFPYPWSTSQRNIFSVSGLQLKENNDYDGTLGANSG